MSARPRPFEKFYINIPFRLLAKIIARRLESTFITPNMIIATGIILVGTGCSLLVFLPLDQSWISIPFILSMALFAALDGTIKFVRQLVKCNCRKNRIYYNWNIFCLVFI